MAVCAGAELANEITQTPRILMKLNFHLLILYRSSTLFKTWCLILINTMVFCSIIRHFSVHLVTGTE